MENSIIFMTDPISLLFNNKNIIFKKNNLNYLFFFLTTLLLRMKSTFSLFYCLFRNKYINKN